MPFVIDVFSRRIVGWKAARTMHAPLVVDALNMAAWTRRGTDLAGLICHSDAGSQYTSIAYTDRLDDIDAAPSIGTVGDSYDNAMAESVNALFKTELHRNPAVLAANGGHWKGLDDLEVATCGWVSWFNEERLHGELGDLTPAEIEAAHYRQDLRPTRPEKPTRQASVKPRPIHISKQQIRCAPSRRVWGQCHGQLGSARTTVSKLGGPE